jgi:hypothetical protein
MERIFNNDQLKIGKYLTLYKIEIPTTYILFITIPTPFMYKQGTKRKISQLSQYIPIRQLVDIVESYAFESRQSLIGSIKTYIALDLAVGLRMPEQIASKLNKKNIKPDHIKDFPYDIAEIYYTSHDYKKRKILLCKNIHDIYIVYISQYGVATCIYVYISYASMMDSVRSKGIDLEHGTKY